MRASRLSCSARLFCATPAVHSARRSGCSARVALVHRLGSILRGLPLNRPTREEAGQTCQRDLAPAIELMGMDTVRGGEVADGLLLLEERLHHLGFAFRATGACAYTCVHLTNSSPIV